eukprot:scaffold99558_cov21-Tisochrysis_lutea.AAC.2
MHTLATSVPSVRVSPSPKLRPGGVRERACREPRGRSPCAPAALSTLGPCWVFKWPCPAAAGAAAVDDSGGCGDTEVAAA